MKSLICLIQQEQLLLSIPWSMNSLISVGETPIAMKHKYHYAPCGNHTQKILFYRTLTGIWACMREPYTMLCKFLSVCQAWMLHMSLTLYYIWDHSSVQTKLFSMDESGYWYEIISRRSHTVCRLYKTIQCEHLICKGCRLRAIVQQAIARRAKKDFY